VLLFSHTSVADVWDRVISGVWEFVCVGGVCVCVSVLHSTYRAGY